MVSRWCPRPRGTFSSSGAPRRPGAASGASWLTIERDVVAGGICMSGMDAGELGEGPCSSVPALCVLASARSRKSHCGFSLVLCAFVIFVIFVVPACRIESMSIA